MTARPMFGIHASLCATALLAGALAGCDSRPRSTPLPAQATYVAMGSSFAAGPGVTHFADTPPNRCGRSADNYAHQLARKRDLRLIDVSCGGATTANILGPWSEIPPQIDAVTADTRLVTLTIGGNDMGYIGGLMAASCSAKAGATGRGCPMLPFPSEKSWTALGARMTAIAQEVHRRAPTARLIFVDYPTVLPAKGGCVMLPVTPEAAERGRAVASRLAALTVEVAKSTGAEVLHASTLSADHGICGAEPWMNGFPPASGGAAYHPNLAGMTAVADALDRLLAR